MIEYRLSTRAEADIRSILAQSIDKFGEHHSRLYLRSLQQCLEMLARFPRLGRSAERIKAGLRRHEHGSHVIFYREERNGILVLTVVHRRRLPRIDDQ